MVKEATPQLSLAVPTSEGTTVALPAASKVTEILLQVRTGLVASSTVTTALQVELLPLLSLTTKVTLLGPTFAQV